MLVRRCAFRKATYPFFFTDTTTTDIYTLSLHDALPIYGVRPAGVRADGLRERRLPGHAGGGVRGERPVRRGGAVGDRKSTRLNSSHLGISYAVFCLKKKTTRMDNQPSRPKKRLSEKSGE